MIRGLGDQRTGDEPSGNQLAVRCRESLLVEVGHHLSVGALRTRSEGAEHGLNCGDVVPDVLSRIVSNGRLGRDRPVEHQGAQALRERLRIRTSQSRAVTHPPEGDLLTAESAPQGIDIADHLPAADEIRVSRVCLEAVHRVRGTRRHGRGRNGKPIHRSRRRDVRLIGAAESHAGLRSPHAARIERHDIE